MGGPSASALAEAELACLFQQTEEATIQPSSSGWFFPGFAVSSSSSMPWSLPQELSESQPSP